MRTPIRSSGLARLAVAAATVVLVAVGALPAHAATYSTVTLTVRSTNIPAGTPVRLTRFETNSTASSSRTVSFGADRTAVFTNVTAGYSYTVHVSPEMGASLPVQSLGGGSSSQDGRRFTITGATMTQSVQFDLVAPAWVTGKIYGSPAVLASTTVYSNVLNEVTRQWVFQSSAKPAADGTYRLPVMPNSRFIAWASASVPVGDSTAEYGRDYGAGRIELPSTNSVTLPVSPASGGTATHLPISLTTPKANLNVEVAGIDDEGDVEVTLYSLATGSRTPRPASDEGTARFTALTPGRYLITAYDRTTRAGASRTVNILSSRTEKLTLAPVIGTLPLHVDLTYGSQIGTLHSVDVKVAGSIPGVTVSTAWTSAQKPVGTGPTYRTTPNDLGNYVRAITVATASGYMPAVALSNLGYVGIGAAPRAKVAPAVSGTFATGRTVTLSKGTWDGAVTLRPQWTRNGVAIPGATKWTYRLTAADMGRRVAATITATLPGHEDGTITVPARTSARGAKASYRATVKGTAKVGSRLTAAKAPSGWKASYRWYRNGKAVKGATKRTYTPVAADAAKRLKVKVKLTRAGYTTTTKTSASTAKVARATARITAKAGKGRATITVKAAGVKAPTGKVTVTDGRARTTVTLKAKQKGKVTVKLARGTRKVTVAYSGSSSVTTTSTRVTLKIR